MNSEEALKWGIKCVAWGVGGSVATLVAGPVAGYLADAIFDCAADALAEKMVGEKVPDRGFCTLRNFLASETTLFRSKQSNTASNIKMLQFYTRNTAFFPTKQIML